MKTVTLKVEDGYFIRDMENDTVTCPMGNTLRRKSTRKNGGARYMNRKACKQCPELRVCYTGKGNHKEIDFPDAEREYVRCKNWTREKTKGEGTGERDLRK